MSFNSIEFVAFLVIVLLVYYQLDHRRQNWFLLVASYVFYGWWDARYLALIVISTAVDYVVGLQLYQTKLERTRKLWLLLSVLTNLGMLFTFKYFNWFADGLIALLADFGLSSGVDSVFFRFTLPIGISFYTFQSMSYTIDIYRRKFTPVRSPLDFAVFVAFFPQLVAGPIERAAQLLPQVVRPRKISGLDLKAGCWLLLFGFFKKVVVADNMGRIASTGFDHGGNIQGWDVIIGVWAFAWQIYGDFSGYSDIARGVSRLLGFNLMLNFRMPYFAANPREFWSRWHISLSSWLRDYLYHPLGGNRFGTFKTYRNLSLTMLLGGLWHGAAWNFVAWGVYQGALLVFHRALLGRSSREKREASANWTPGRILRVALFFQAVCFGWVLFRVNALSDVVLLWDRMMIGGGSLFWPAVYTFLLAAPVLILDWGFEKTGDELVVHRWPLPFRVLTYTVLCTGILALGVRDGIEFIYFQF